MTQMLIHHPVLGYLDAHDGNGNFEWTFEPKTAWTFKTDEGERRLKTVLKYHAHARLVPRKGAAKHQSVRRFWTPKLKPCGEQCASCPFRAGNDAEFGAVVAKLKKKAGVTGPVTTEEIEHARKQVKDDLLHTGDFACHGTVYHDDMSLKEPGGRRQCPGATAFWKGGGNA